MQPRREAGESARTIAKEIGVSLTTVTREIRKHTYESFKGCYGRSNPCVHRQDCRLTQVCNGCPGRKSCHKRKLVYDASRAYGDYRRVLSERRQGASALKWNRVLPTDHCLNPVAFATPRARLAP